MDAIIRCTKCKQERPWALFSPNTVTRHLHGATKAIFCDPCRAAINDRLSRTQGGDPAEQRRLAERGDKRCSRCRQIKPLDAFNTNTRAYDGVTPSCRACKSAYEHSRATAKRATRATRYPPTTSEKGATP